MPLDAPYLEAIRGFEGFSPKAQWDYKQHSVGYGSKALSPDEEIDEPTARTRHAADLASAEAQVTQAFPGVQFTPGRLAALTSLTQNAGNGWTNAGLGDAIRRDDWNDAASRFTQYNQAGGKYNEGLNRRRGQEVAWFDGNEAPIGSAFKEQGKANMTPMELAMMQQQQPQNILPQQPPQQEEPQPSLGAKFMAGGPGALFGAPNGVFPKPDGSPGYDLGNALQGAGAWAMANDHPEALGVLKTLKHEGEGNFALVQNNETGQFMRINKKTGAVTTGGMPGFDPNHKANQAYDAEASKGFAQLNQEIPKSATGVEGSLATSQQIRQLLSNPSVYQGSFGETAQSARKLAQSMGIKTDGVDDANVAQALANQMTLGMRQYAGGMPGSLSDKDLAFLKNATVSLNNTPEANQQILDAYDRSLKRTQAIEGLRQQYTANGKRLDQGFYTAISQYDAEQAKARTATPTTAAPAAASSGVYKVLKVH